MNIEKRLGISFSKISVISHPKCDEEFENIINESSDKEKLLGQYRQRLKFLEDEIKLFRRKKDWFGVLESNKKFNKIKFVKTEQNIRIAFYVTGGSPPKVILLYAFKEKSGSDGKVYEYKNASDIVENRLKEVLKNVGK